MSLTHPTPSSSGSKNRSGVFRSWIAQHQDLTLHIHEDEWHHFFQFVLKALPGHHSERVYRFLDFYLPRLFRNEVTCPYIIDSLATLRSLLIEEISAKIPVGKRSKLLRQILGQFDQIILFVQEKYLLHAEPELNSLNNLFEEQLKQLKSMGFYARGRRFAGNGHQNAAFYQWTNTDAARHIAAPVWEDVIHPDDYLDVQTRIREVMDKKQTIYELNYRLRNHKGDWEHVVELGRIAYKTDWRPDVFTGVISEASARSQHLIQDSELVKIFRFLLDDQKDLALTLDNDGRILYATNRIEPYLAGQNNQSLTLTDRSFWELLGSDNRIVAQNAWEAFSANPEYGRKVLLKLADEDRNGRIIEFTFHAVRHSFKKQIVCLTGRIVSKRSSSELYLEQSRELIRLFENPSTDSRQLYTGILEIALKLIPAAQCAAYLLKTPFGYRFHSGVGYEVAQLNDLVLLDKAAVRKLKSWDEISGISRTVKRLVMSEIGEQLVAALPEARRELLLTHGRLAETNQLLTGLVRTQGESHGIFLLGTIQQESQFSENDLHLFDLFTRQIAGYLSHEHLDRDFREIAGNYHNLLKHAPIACFVIQENRLKDFNPRFLAMMGYVKDEMIVRDLWRHLHPDDLQRFQMDLAALTDRYTVIDSEFRLIDKKKREISCSGALLHIDIDGAPAALCMALDVTRMKQLEKESGQIEQNTVAVDRYSKIAHDFNNILGTIIPGSQLIMNNPESSRTHNRARIIFHMAQRALQISQGMLNVPNQQAGGDTEAIDMRHLLEENLGMLQRLAGKAVCVRLELNDQPVKIAGNYKSLVQLFINLLLNARDAMPDGGDLRISCNLQHMKEHKDDGVGFRSVEHAVISVSDSGSGIPREIRSEIFKPFFTTKAKGQGAGLGLTVVRTIIREHNGSILVRSNDTRGITFKICLPLLVSGEVETTAITVPAVAVNGNGAHAKRNLILVVDDEQYLREVFVSMLKMNGYSCIEASSGQEAVEIFRKKHQDIDLVILDYAMPGLSGAETYAQLKKIHATARIMLCTGFADQKEISRFIKNGEMEYLPKPFTIEILSKKVRTALQPRRELKHG